MGKKEHSPSKYRAIARDARSGKRGANALSAEARSLPDPYYTSLALFDISLGKNIEPGEASTLSAEAISLAEKENREWRRAELLTELARKSKSLAPEARKLARARILKAIEEFPKGKPNADLIAGCAPHLAEDGGEILLRAALENTNLEVESAKPVIKAGFGNQDSSDSEINMISGMLATITDPRLRVRLYGYAHVQSSRSGNPETDMLASALATVKELEGGSGYEEIKYLVDQSDSLDDLELIAAAVTEFGIPETEARSFISLAARADRLGHAELARDWFDTAQEITDDIEDPGTRARTKLNLAGGLEKMGEADIARIILESALADAKGDVKLMAKISRTLSDESPGMEHKGPAPKPENVVPEAGKRHVLALYDTYEGGLKPIHLRMIARAAPLCIAFNLDLALIDFPTDNLENLLEKVLADTNIGKSGHYLKELQASNRIFLICMERSGKTSPEMLDDIGLPVATTSAPSKSKSASLEEAGRISKNHPTGRLVLLMGLGKKGLPKSILASLEHHVEVTGKNISLETSTAMGIIAQKLGTLGD